jgi:Protein of unknown function (DUF732)
MSAAPADDAPNTAVADDDTGLLDTAAAPEPSPLAWSTAEDDDGDGNEPPARRGHRWRWVLAATLAAVALVAVLILSGVFYYRNTRATAYPPARPAPTSQPAASPAAPAPPLTVTVTPAPEAAPAPTPTPTVMPSPQSQDRRYLQMLDAAGVPYANAAGVIDTGNFVCNYLAQGHYGQETIRMLRAQTPMWTYEQADAVMEAAVKVYCP